MAVLLAVEGPSAGVRFRIDADADVGRASTCCIRIHDERMSRRHALLSFDGEAVTVSDLGSRNGTFVNDRRADAPVRLTPGDRVRIGGSTFLFEPSVDLVPSRFTGGAVVFDDEARLDEALRVDAAAADPADLLGRLALRLSAAEDPASALSAAAEVVTHGFGAEAGGVLLAGAGRAAVPVALVGGGDLVLTEGWVEAVLRDGLPRLGRLGRGEGARTVLSAPVTDGRGIRGLLHLEGGGGPGAPWGEGELVRLAACGRLLGLALRAAGRRRGSAGEPVLVGDSPAFRVLRRGAEALVESEAPLLLEGEPGTGRHHLARWLHAQSPRREGPFVTLAVQGTDPTTLAARLFGRELPGLEGDRIEPGALETADGGTLYLGALDALSAPLQARLARALDQRALVREGGQQPVSIDVRLVGARAPLSAGGGRREVARAFGRRRLELPPLRERRGDLGPLFAHFARLAARRLGRAPIELAPEAEEAASRYPWPGNLVELDLVVRRLTAIRPAGAEIDAGDLPAPRRGPVAGVGAPLAQQIAALEAGEIERVLEEEGGRKIHAARRLGLSRPTLDRKIALYGIEVPRPSRAAGSRADPE